MRIISPSIQVEPFDQFNILTRIEMAGRSGLLESLPLLDLIRWAIRPVLYTERKRV